MRVAVQMDPIDTMVVARDTSLAFMIEAQARGAEVWWFTPGELFYDTGVLKARARRVSVWLDEARHYETHEDAVRAVDDFDVVLIRQDPPFDMGYVSNTYLLEQTRALVVNPPRAVRNMPEKLSTMRFADVTPATFIGRDVAGLTDFARRYEQVVMKPSFFMGGEGIIKLRADAPDFEAQARDFIAANGVEPIVAQEFLPRVSEGDKRVFVLGGEVIGAVRRLPMAGEFRANLHAGGSANAAELDEADRRIAARVAPLLAEEGIVFAGLDVIDGKLTEINVTSPTLVRELKRFGGADIPKLFWDRLAVMLAGR